MKRPRKKSNLTAARARMYHELVFECAERVFAEEGFDTATMQDLANEAGVSLKTVYATFAGKDEIYREILTVRGLGLAEGIQSIVGGEGTALDRMERSLVEVVGYLVEHRAFLQDLNHLTMPNGPQAVKGKAQSDVGLMDHHVLELTIKR